MTLQECKQANLDIVCLQEVRMLNTGSLSHLGYSFYWSGPKKYKRQGVAIAIRKSPYITTESIQCINNRLIAADVLIKGCKLRIISSYAPTLYGYALSTKQAFYRELSKLCKVEGNRKVIVQGDFNAELEICRTNSRFDGRSTRIEEGLNQVNENGMLFLQFCIGNELSILNTWFDHLLHHRITWHSPNGVTKKVYDYSLSCSWIRQFVNDVRVRNSYFNSDHRLVVTKLKTPANKAARRYTRTRHKPKPNMKLLQNELINSRATCEIQKYLEENSYPDPSVDQMHGYLVNALNSGRKVIPPVTRSKYKIPWEKDEMLTSLTKERRALRKKEVTPQVKAHLKTLRKQINKRAKELRNKILKEKGKEINSAKHQRNLAKMWKQAKNHNSIIVSKPKSLQCPGLTEHFKKHFNPDHSSLTTPALVENPPDFIQILRDSNLEIIESPPSHEEIDKAIGQLNNGKSCTDVEAEVVKVANCIPQFQLGMKSYFEKIWTTKEIPAQWRSSRITPIWKRKGSALDPSNYRGISTSSTLCKIGMNVILTRLSNFYDAQLQRTQFGFRKGVGCNDAIYMVKQLQEIASTSQQNLYCCFIDLSAAFDHINRDILFKTIKNRLTPSKQNNSNILVLQNLYSSTKSYVQNDDPNTKSFPVKSGSRQGGVEGPPLYNYYADYALRCYEHQKNESVPGLAIPYVIPNEATYRAQRDRAPTSGTFNDSESVYADDSGIFCWSQDDLQLCINILQKIFVEFGLNINIDKTKTMIFRNCPALPEDYPESILSINDTDIENVPHFKYLGVWLHSDQISIGHEELKYRVDSAFIAFAENKKLLTNYNILLKTRIMFLNALVRSRLTYGCHTWRPTSSEMSKLDATYRYMLRCMVRNGHSRVNPPRRQQDNSDLSFDEEDDEETEYDWSYMITNQSLHQMTRTETIQNYFKCQQENYIAHLVRRENSNSCKILTFHDTFRKKRGRRSLTILEQVVENSGMSKSQFLRACFESRNNEGRL